MPSLARRTHHRTPSVGRAALSPPRIPYGLSFHTVGVGVLDAPLRAAAYQDMKRHYATSVLIETAPYAKTDLGRNDDTLYPQSPTHGRPFTQSLHKSTRPHRFFGAVGLYPFLCLPNSSRRPTRRRKPPNRRRRRAVSSPVATHAVRAAAAQPGSAAQRTVFQRMRRFFA